VNEVEGSNNILNF